MFKTILIIIVSFVAGLIGCAQILWSMKKVKSRGLPLTIATAFAWALIMFGIAALVQKYIPGQLTTLFLGYGAAFVVLFLAQLLQLNSK